MNRVCNHIDFVKKFGDHVKSYEEKVRARIIRLRADLDPENEQRLDAYPDRNLEAHIRRYIVDPLFAALNWRTDSNLFIETAIQSQEIVPKRRFLDYLGVEKNTNTPLLVIEAKRPGTPLPSAVDPARSDSHEELIANALKELSEPLRKQNAVNMRWEAYLIQLLDYVRAVYDNTRILPVRVVITNGDWLIIFENVHNAFIEGADGVVQDHILLLKNRDEVISSARDLFRSLDYYSLIPRRHPLTPSELRAVISPDDIDYGLRAVEVNYNETPTANEPVPNINITPIMMICLRSGGFIRINAQESDRMPHWSESMTGHLERVTRIHDRLHQEVHNYLGTKIGLRSNKFQYLDTEVHRDLPGNIELGFGKYLIATGDAPHFIVNSRDYDDCPFHRADAAATENRLIKKVPTGPSVAVRTHFAAGSAQCCVHSDVYNLKRIQVTETNRDRFLPRTEREDGPFCKLWGFETLLCCKRCIFQDICAASIGAVMPCRAAEDP